MDGSGRGLRHPGLYPGGDAAWLGINSIGSMQATIRLEDDLDDFMHAILFQPGGPQLQLTGTAGWELDLVQGQFRMTR